MPLPHYGVSAHGFEVAVESSPVVSGTFVPVGGLNSDITLAFSRAWTKTTPHNRRVSGGITSNVIELGEVPFELNYDPAATTGAEGHAALAAHFWANESFGVRMRGPEGATGDDEVIVSGELTGYEQRNPVDAGQRVLALVFHPSGPFIVDGVEYGT